MASRRSGTKDLKENEHRLFIQQIGHETTESSLKSALSKYRIDRLRIPCDRKTGENQGHAIVMFLNKESVDEFMKDRPHMIDGHRVIVHRSVPNQPNSRENCTNPFLVVSVLNNQSLTEPKIRNYFNDYGHIVVSSMTNGDNKSWTIEFDDYDSVDQILLDHPHRIGDIDVDVKKADKKPPQARPTTTPPPPDTTKVNVARPLTKQTSRVTIDDKVSCLQLPPKQYCIHITNLPPLIDGETLSDQFDWELYDIVMHPEKWECWLKHPRNEQHADDFIREWNGKNLSGLFLHCQKEEDEPELCNKYQYGRCKRLDHLCDWEHIPCTANGKCASTCSYGHNPGVKSPSIPARKGKQTEYRIRFSGFQDPIAPEDLSKMFNQPIPTCYVSSKQNHVGYIVKIKTMKYAKALIQQWNHREINGSKLKCQLELNFKPSSSRTEQAPSERSSVIHRARKSFKNQNSDPSSDHEEMNGQTATSYENREHGRETRLLGKALDNSTSTATRRDKSPGRTLGSSTEAKYQLPKDVATNLWEITNKPTTSDGKVLLIRGQSDRKRFAAIKIYDEIKPSPIYQEFTALQDLKDVKGVCHLIASEKESNNLTWRNPDSDKLWFIMERAPGSTLKEFVENNLGKNCQIPDAIDVALKLIKIVRDVHKKNIFHQNISPENILIALDHNKKSVQDAQLTLINFSQASVRARESVSSTKQFWYRPTQLGVKGLNSTVDTSGICALLFWLLTRISPQDQNSSTGEKTHKIIEMAVRSTKNDSNLKIDEKQMTLFLTDTFDRAFDYSRDRLWTIDDLECRLKLIKELFTTNNSKLDNLKEIFNQLTSIRGPISSRTTNENLLDPFARAAKELSEAKKDFVKNENQFCWSDGHCQWIQNSTKESRHDDILISNCHRGY